MIRTFIKNRAFSFKQLNKRNFHLHEYQSKELMNSYGVNTQKFVVVDNVDNVLNKIESLNVSEYVVKAQIHAGGRGKGTFSSGLKGGVHITKNVTEVEQLCRQMINSKLITKQTTSNGSLVKKVMIAEALEISKETYFAIVLDQALNGPVMLGSPKGGVDIEEVALKHPELIFKEPINVANGLKPEQSEKLAKLLGFQGNQVIQAQSQMNALYRLFVDVDAVQIEVNPLGETPQGQIVCFDAKLDFDENASFRQEKIFSLKDSQEEDPLEIEAKTFGLNFVRMEGNIGCIVNGAGLAMATMDIIKLNGEPIKSFVLSIHCSVSNIGFVQFFLGGKPANFLDLGGEIKEQYVCEALRILSQDKKIKSIFVNIFGGIVDCSMVSRGIIKAIREKDIRLPIIIRLRGTNEREAKDIVAFSGCNLKIVDDMNEAARFAINNATKHISS